MKKPNCQALKVGFAKTSLLFVLFTVLHSCKEETAESSKQQIIENVNFEKLIDVKTISKELTLAEDTMTIDWSQPTILDNASDDVIKTYQFPILCKNPVYNNSDLFVKELTFYLIVEEAVTGIKFTVLRFEPFIASANTKPSESNIEGFSGMKFLFNEAGVMKDIYTYQEGVKIASFKETKKERRGKYTDILLPKADDSQFNDCMFEGKPIPGCIPWSSGGSGGGSGGGDGYKLEVTRRFTDWYNKCNTCTSSDGSIYDHTDGNRYVYVKTVYNGSTSRWIWLPSASGRLVDLYYSQSGGGAGGPRYSGGGRDYSTNNILPCPIGFKRVGYNCVKVEDERVIDNTKNPCVSNIINILKRKDIRGTLVPDLTKKSHLSQSIIAIFNSSRKYHLTYSIGQLDHLGQGVNANTATYKVTLDVDMVKEATQLSIARTIIHESLHAFFHYTLKTKFESPISILLMEYFRKNYNKGNLTEHQFMTQYVEAIAYSLSAYDGHRQNFEYYKSLSWGGLEATNAYKSIPINKRNKIQTIIPNERFAKRAAKSIKCN